MATKRVSELVQISAPELSVDDLLFLADVTAYESKKLRLGDLNSFFQASGNSGSFYGTASWAQNAVYALNSPQQSTASYSYTSSWASNILTSSYSRRTLSASIADSSSYNISSSYSATASFLNGLTLVDYSKTASFLQYSSLRSNGTASAAMTASRTIGTSSYALTASNTIGTASFSNTASHAIFALYAVNAGSGGSGLYALSASFASSSALSTLSTSSLSASHLTYNGEPNGTASYAISAGRYPNIRVNFGIWQAHTQSVDYAQIDHIHVDGVNSDGPQSSSLEVWGTLYVAGDTLTSSTGSIEFIALNRWTGITTSIDRSPIDLVLPSSGGGSMTYPFSLAGEIPLSGSYMLYVTCSGDIKPIIVNSRKVRFEISSLGEVSEIHPDEGMSFMATQVGGLNPQFYYSSSGELYYGSQTEVVFSGSSVTDINISNKILESIRYLWTLTGLKRIVANNNPNLSDVGGMPNSMVSMSFRSCNLPSFASLTYTSASYLDLYDNDLRSVPEFASSMSYIDISGNANIFTLPPTLPSGLLVFKADTTSFAYPPSLLPNTLISMSVSDNSMLTTWNTSFPTSLEYFDCSTTSLTSLPSMPSAMKYLNISNALFTSLAIDTIAIQLVSGGLNNGRVNVSGNIPSGSYSATATNNFGTLISRGWTVTT